MQDKKLFQLLANDYLPSKEHVAAQYDALNKEVAAVCQEMELANYENLQKNIMEVHIVSLHVISNNNFF